MTATTAIGRISLLNAGVNISEIDQVLAVAQDVVNRHAIVCSTGLCVSCGTPGTCERRWLALRVLARHRRLPYRVPGLSRPELIGARRVDASLEHAPQDIPTRSR